MRSKQLQRGGECRAADWSSHLVSELFGLFFTTRKRLNEVRHLQRDRSERVRQVREADGSERQTGRGPAGRSSVGPSPLGLPRRPAAVCAVAPSIESETGQSETGRGRAAATWPTGRQTGGGTLLLERQTGQRDRRVREWTRICSVVILVQNLSHPTEQ